MTDVELILNRDIEALRTRHAEHAAEYATTFGYPHLVDQIVSETFERMRSEPFEGELTVNQMGEPTFMPWFYGMLNSVAVASIKASR